MKLRKRILVFAVVSVLTFMLLGSAHAGLCIIPDEEGTWLNYDRNTRGITELKFRTECRSTNTAPSCTSSGGITICTGTNTSNSGVEPHYFIRLWGSCSPRDCDWGEVEGVALTGSLDGWYRFYYNQGFAKRWVYARTYPQWPGWLRLYVYTDFTDPSRADYVMDDWFTDKIRIILH